MQVGCWSLNVPKGGAHCEEDSRMRRLVLLSTSQIWRPKPNGKAGDC